MPEAPAATTLPEMATREEERELIHEVADAVGALMEFWGFKRVMGRLWTVLYLTGEPLAAAELCERLAISSGAASMTLADLERWGVVKRSRKAGDRREYFEAETDVWKMVSRVLRERERSPPESRRGSRGWSTASRAWPIWRASGAGCSPRWCSSTRSTWRRWSALRPAAGARTPPRGRSARRGR
jgi:DNA-binding MarR family transcriptional regulator